MTIDAARAWLATFHTTRDTASTASALSPLLIDFTNTYNQKQGAGDLERNPMPLVIDKWLFTGNVAGIYLTSPQAVTPELVEVLQRTRVCEPLHVPWMVVYSALLHVRDEAAINTALPMWLTLFHPDLLADQSPEARRLMVYSLRAAIRWQGAQRPGADGQGESELARVAQLWEKERQAFLKHIELNTPFIMMGTYQTTHSEVWLKRALRLLETLHKVLRSALADKANADKLPLCHTSHALRQLSSASGTARQWLRQYTATDPALKKALADALA